MNISKISSRVQSIVSDSALSIDDRIEEVFSLGDISDKIDEKDKLKVDVVCFKSLIEMIRGEEAYSTHIMELMQLFTLLAEAYGKLEDYRPLDRLSFDVREVLRDERISWDVLEETLPRIIEVMEESVYHYETYRLLLVYIHTAFVNGKLDKEMKGYVRHMLKLNILLEDNSWHSHWIDNELKAAIAGLFKSDELLKIILNPAIGHLKVDPVEYTAEWENIYYDVEDELNRRFKNVHRHMGFCFRYWGAKQELLKEKYNIDWHSPSQMNPRVMFD